MSKTEEDFERFLRKNKIKYKSQYKIEGAPFNRRNYHLVDFYLPELDLYVEVKGFMTLYQVNVLTYLSKYSGKHFYILQVTEEDWIRPYSKEIDGSLSNKFIENKEIQYNEILKLQKGKYTAKELNKLSFKRLNQYIKHRSKDLDRWIK